MQQRQWGRNEMLLREHRTHQREHVKALVNIAEELFNCPAQGLHPNLETLHHRNLHQLQYRNLLKE